MMADLAVTPEHLIELAAQHDQAATDAHQATSAATNIKTDVWVTHGVICGSSNVWFARAEKARRDVGKSLEQACRDLAGTLRTASEIYDVLDIDLGENLNIQVLDH